MLLQRFEKSARVLLILLGSLVIMGCSISWFDAFRLSYVNLLKWEDLIFGSSEARGPDLAPNSPAEATALPELDEGPAGKLVIARGSFELDTQVKTDALGGGYQHVEGPVELSFYPQGGPVTGIGSVIYDAWSKGCPPGRFENIAKFTGTSFPDGTASGMVAVTNVVAKSEGCVYTPAEIKVVFSWEARFGNGIFEGQILNNDGSTLPFKLTY